MTTSQSGSSANMPTAAVVPPANPTQTMNTPSPAYAVDSPAPTHPVIIGYVFWIFGFIGAHRFYFGKPLTGAIWFLTGGVFLIGWIIDLFLVPSMAQEANRRYHHGRIDHSVCWCLLLFSWALRHPPPLHGQNPDRDPVHVYRRPLRTRLCLRCVNAE